MKQLSKRQEFACFCAKALCDNIVCIIRGTLNMITLSQNWQGVTFKENSNF